MMEERNMSRAHEPREDFVNQLELRLRADFRQRRLAATPPRTWIPQSRWALAGMLLAIAIGSMAMGGGIVAAAYEARYSEQREMLLESFQQREKLAQQRLALVTQQLRNVQGRVSVGIDPPDAVSQVQVRVTEAEAELKSLELDIAEIRASGREPMQSPSSPLVSGRDFVTERWKVEMAVPTAALALERGRAQAARGRVEIGITSPAEVEAIATRVVELESAVETFQRKLELRQAFLKGGVPSATADLRALEAETEIRRRTFLHRIGASKRRVQELKGKIEVGTANPLELAEAELQLQELELGVRKVEYELLLIRKQLGK
jgi:hypothetical protein